MTLPNSAEITLREMLTNGSTFLPPETRYPGDTFKVKSVVGKIITGNWLNPGPGMMPNVTDLGKFEIAPPAWVKNERIRRSETY